MRTDRFISKRPLGRLTSALKCRRKSYFPSHEILVLVFQDYVLETLAVLNPGRDTMSMITASLWVPRGAATAFPEKYDVDEDELARISKLAKLQLEDAKEDLSDAKNGRQGDTEAEESDAEEHRVKLGQSQA